MTKRIIPCLDIRNGRVVKGKKFQDIQDVADPLTLAKKYEQDKADVLFLLDITGDNRAEFLQIVKDIAASVSIPLYVGGAIRTVADIQKVLQAGAKKASITSAALERPEFLREASAAFGDARIILSIDAKQVATNKWHAFTAGGKKDSGRDVIEWALYGEEAKVSEILLNSIDTDGVQDGYALDLNKQLNDALSIPVIASGGAGTMEHFKDVFTKAKAEAALAASVFHYDDISIINLKQYLNGEGIDVTGV